MSVSNRQDPRTEPTTQHDIERVLVHRSGVRPGPAFLAVGSLHGNEPAGRLALERVTTLLHEAHDRDGFELSCGDFLGIAGNLSALEMRMRYIDSDLNRGWSQARIQRLEEEGPRSVEDREMLEIYTVIEGFRGGARGPLVFLDLHTTSGESPPFASVADRPADRELVSALPVPTVLGVDTHLEGTFLEYMQNVRFTGIVFEGGQHDAPAAIDYCEASIWLILEKLGLVEPDECELLAQRIQWSRQTLDVAGGDYPELLRVEYRHDLDTGRNFVMCPGYRSFQPVRKGELLARHRDREIRSERDAIILMPLYQPQGNEGFFLMSEVQPTAS